MLIVTCLAPAGCGKSDKVDSSKPEKSFSTAQPASKSAVDELQAAPPAQHYANAGAALQEPAWAAGRTSDQKRAIDDAAAQLRERMAQKAKQAAKEGDEPLGGMQARISK